MTERPILFSGPMVNAILAGRKTMTRRVVKPQDSVEECDGEVIHLHSKTCGSYCDYACGPLSCPYGQPGDRLWVRETFRVFGGREYEYQQHQPSVIYRANILDAVQWLQAEWRPSIFMPRWASRITLEVTDVRVQRLVEISCADAIAEGIAPTANSQTIDCDTPDPRVKFQELWGSINAKRCPWASNPFVWVVSFKLTNQGLQG